jgi:uncharacterized protein (DUF4415 family)
LVLAHNPQSTLDPAVVPWEKRYPRGTRQDWSGDFADAADAAPVARKIYITYDPFYSLDKRHIERLGIAPIEHLKMPFLGHRTPDHLNDMRILKPTTEMALDESLSSESFAKLARERRSLPRYYARTAWHLIGRQRFSDAERVAEMGLAVDPDSSTCRKVLEVAQERRTKPGRAVIIGGLPAQGINPQRARVGSPRQATAILPSPAKLVRASQAKAARQPLVRVFRAPQTKVKVMLSLDRDLRARLFTKGATWQAWVNAALRAALDGGGD